MNNDNKRNQPIGFLDSGLGGLSVLRESIRIMPHEDFIYYGDSKNAPYGNKSTERIKELTFAVVDKLLDYGIKALVVACNTATGACIEDLRAKYPDMPIIGIEPAIKPAVICNEGGRIIVMATPATIKQSKFKDLVDYYSDEAEIYAIGCEGLMEFVEQGNFNQDIINDYLDKNIAPALTNTTESIVLGCTHYPFIGSNIKKYLGNRDIKLIDGSKGTSSQLKRKLLEYDLFTDRLSRGKIEIINSADNQDEMIERSWKLLNMPL